MISTFDGLRRSLVPFKTKLPLVINPDTVSTLSVALQRFKAIAGQYRKISDGDSRLQSVHLQASRAFNPEKFLYPFSGSEAVCPSITFFMRYVKHKAKVLPEIRARASPRPQWWHALLFKSYGPSQLIILYTATR
jgi:hypothetical protein